ncbi:MAG: hypothetical protein C4617_01475 [Candidatus Liberibacter europaeus]|uniref:Uncharacterized protein n=1 Tax=Candidatus Liberibacter europaeus TaxID=744859 RepID=A0A2T4VXL7_9HYPH|nr:hypothetical protein [Candidatus Liberibacter europaeus]PTL86519.1 MAG: hypothetical protein C4617_01475 [Candidatus Liberibacter europaeus]
MKLENYFLENFINENKKASKLRPMAQIFHEIALHAIMSNRKQTIKSITREFIESWMTYNSRAWRISQPRTNLNINISSRESTIPVLIHIGNIKQNIIKT